MKKALSGQGNGNKIAIHDTVAESVTKVLIHGLEDGTAKALEKAIDMPSNCERMTVVSCNSEVYRHASMEARKN